MSAQPAERLHLRPSYASEVLGYEQDLRGGELPSRVGHFIGEFIARASEVEIVRYEPKDVRRETAFQFVGRNYGREMSAELRDVLPKEIAELLGKIATARANEEAIVLPLGVPEKVELFDGGEVDIEKYGAEIAKALSE